MEQNKIRSYFLYAIGEIALVMIGILLALQVNNWNEQRKIKQEVDKYVVSLFDEVQDNYLYMSRVYNRHEKLLDGSRKAAEMLFNKEIPLGMEQTFYDGIESLGFYGSMKPFRTVYDEAIRVGILQNIENDTARFRINLFFSEVDDYSENLEFFRNTYDDPVSYALDAYKTIYDSTEESAIRYDADFDKLFSTEIFTTKVNDGLRNAIVFQSYRKRLVTISESTCKIFARELNTTCSSRYQQNDNGD